MNEEKIQEIVDEIKRIVTAPRADTDDPDETIELIKIKLSSFLAHNPDEAKELEKRMKSKFLMRRIAQMHPDFAQHLKL